MKTMRRSGLLLALGALLAIGPTGAKAEADYPVCLHVYGPITYDVCQYSTIAQCKASASGQSASCQVNPFYRGPDRNRRRWPPAAR